MLAFQHYVLFRPEMGHFRHIFIFIAQKTQGIGLLELVYTGARGQQKQVVEPVLPTPDYPS